ncbi:MAG: phosphotransferase [Gudongella sp.]|nr:phosphotransferase [Gudongella sp.]
MKYGLIEMIKEYININKYTRLIDLDLDKNVDVKFLAQGEYNINYTIESLTKKYVFRVNIGSQLGLNNQIEYEYNALKYLEGSDVTPKVYFVDNSREYFEYGILIMEFLKGEPLEYHSDLIKAADIFSKIHSIEIKKNHNFLVEENIFTDRITESEILLKNLWDTAFIDKKTKLFFHKLLDWSKYNSYKEKYFLEKPWHVINNTEVNSHNFIIGREKSYLIDWEKPVISDPSQDLTQFLAPTTTLWRSNYVLTQSEIEDFFKSYIRNQKNNKDIRERVELYTPYLYLRALSWCVFAYIEYQNPNKTIKNMDTYEKIKSYLDILFMEQLLKKYNI